LRLRRCRNLAEVRREIDRLDKAIVKLLAKRAGYVGEAARVKERPSQIVDRARIEAVVEKARARAAALDADPDTIARIYRAMIDAFIALERHAFARKSVARLPVRKAAKRRSVSAGASRSAAARPPAPRRG
jgi:isochorismate pyruvate lyase